MKKLSFITHFTKYILFRLTQHYNAYSECKKQASRGNLA